MYEFFPGLQKYLPAFTPEFAYAFATQADSLAELERRQRMIETLKHDAFVA